MKTLFLSTYLTFFLLFNFANACSCERQTESQIAILADSVALLKIKQPDLKQRFNNFYRKLTGEKYFRYEVDVLDSFKNKFQFSYVNSLSKASSNCGIEFEYGDEFYYAKMNASAEPTIGICNFISKNSISAEKIKAYATTRSEVFNPLNLKDFELIYADAILKNYADLKHKVTKDDYVTFWTYTNSISNDIGKNYKSFKSNVTISCKHKKFNFNSSFFYTESNATGKIVDAIDSEYDEIYDWIEINDGHSMHKVMSKVCK